MLKNVNIVCAGGNGEGKAQEFMHYYEGHCFLDFMWKLYFGSITLVTKGVRYFPIS